MSEQQTRTLDRESFFRKDWSRTPLGSASGWSEILLTWVNFLLDTPQPMFLAWGEARTFLFNDRYAQQFGYDPDLHLGTSVRELWAPIADFVDELDRTVFAGGSFMVEDTRFPTFRSGFQEQRYYNFSVSPVRDADGAVLAAACFMTDRTHKLAVEQEIAHERDQLLTTFEEAPVLLAVATTPDFMFEYANRAYRTLVRRERLKGKTVAQALPEVVEQGFLDLLHQVHETGRPVQARDVPLTIGGEQGEEPVQRFVDFVCQPIKDAEGKVARLLCAGMDATERHLAQEKSERLQRDLQQALQFSAMGTMAATLAHELNQPLTAANNYIVGTRRALDRLGRGGSEQVEQGLRLAGEQIQRAGEIIRRVRSLLDNKPNPKAPVSLRAVVEHVRKSLHASGECRPEHIRHALAAGADLVMADEVQLEQVLLNLVRNACQATSDVERPRVLVSSRQTGSGLVQVCVKDNGRGIDPEVERNLFTAFSKSTTGGLGLGSSICRTIVEAHGGRIWAENNEDGGASFYFTLPKAAEPRGNTRLIA